MKFDRQLNNFFPKNETDGEILSQTERQAIEMRADIRKRQQKFKIDALNLEQPGANEAIKTAHEKTLRLVFNEVGGASIIADKPKEELAKEAETLALKGEKKQGLFPDLAAYHYACAVKAMESAGGDFQDLLAKAKECSEQGGDIPKTSPGSLLPDAVLLGVQVRQIAKSSLPEKEKIARTVVSDHRLLENYALILSEEERADFISMIPEEKRQLVSRIFDVFAAQVLNQSIVEKKSADDAQRGRVRLRLYNELKQVVEKGEAGDSAIAKIMAEAMGSLGEDMRQLLLEIIRDNFEGGMEKKNKKADHLPRAIKVFLDNFEDWRGNDIVLRLAGAEDVNHHLSIYLLGKLIKNGYLEKNVKEWWTDRKAVAKKKKNNEPEDEKARLEIIKKVIIDLGVVPSRQILEFVGDEKEWGGAGLDERVKRIKESQVEFEKAGNARELVRMLRQDDKRAMTYFLLYGGSDRFNLINNYSFSKFKEMLSLIDDLKIHERPIKEFGSALVKGGVEKKEADEIIKNLKNGHFPLSHGARETAVSFDVSENAAIKTANLEIGRVLGRGQLGVVLLFPLYRSYLENEKSDEAESILKEMQAKETFTDRLAMISKIEEARPNFKNQALGELKDNWQKLGEKMVLEIPLENVFSDEAVPVKGEEILPRLDAKRIDLKRIKKDLLVILKGGNKRLSAVQKEILKKKKALSVLRDGLDRQESETQKKKLNKNIANIENELKELEAEKNIIGDREVTDRFAHLSEAEKKTEIEKLGNEILALTEKSPSAIFTYITMQVLGEEKLREKDIALVEEMESHLQGPFQIITDVTTYQRPSARDEKKRMNIKLAFVDKQKRLMNMVRFADSRTCCFSSDKYNMVIQHGTPNKYWVASINADPLSFVLSMEMPQEQAQADKKIVKKNLGFIFGSFGKNDRGGLALMLNGIYYGPGGLDSEIQVEAILAGVERLFKGLPVETQVIASQHGGLVKIPAAYSNSQIELTRLRALDDNSGDPESKVYDDLGTGEHLNQRHYYGGNVWHKEN